MPNYRLKTGKTGEKVVGVFKKIEGTVVGGYQAMEHGVVKGYQQIENKFVETFLEELPPDNSEKQ